MKHLSAAVAAILCASALVVAAPSESFAGGGHGYKRHHGHHHHYGHRGHRGHWRHWGHHRHGYRHHRRSSVHFDFSFYGHRPHYGPSYGYTRHYGPPQVVYVQPPPVQWVQPRPQFVSPPPVQQPLVQQQWAPAPAKLPEGCRMVREFQTQVVVGGELVDAYGDVCLKPDGTWERGPAKIVPQ